MILNGKIQEFDIKKKTVSILFVQNGLYRIDKKKCNGKYETLNS